MAVRTRRQQRTGCQVPPGLVQSVLMTTDRNVAVLPVPAEGLVSALAKQLRKAAQIHVAAAHDDTHALTMKLLAGLNGRCQ